MGGPCKARFVTTPARDPSPFPSVNFLHECLNITSDTVPTCMFIFYLVETLWYSQVDDRLLNMTCISVGI